MVRSLVVVVAFATVLWLDHALAPLAEAVPAFAGQYDPGPVRSPTS